MRWLDMFIDYGHQAFADRTVGSRLDFGPYTRVGSVFNAVLCAVLLVVCIWTGLKDQLPGFGGVIFLGVLEVLFVRVCVLAFRGDFDDFVLEPDDEDAR